MSTIISNLKPCTHELGIKPRPKIFVTQLALILQNLERQSFLDEPPLFLLPFSNIADKKWFARCLWRGGGGIERRETLRLSRAGRRLLVSVREIEGIL